MYVLIIPTLYITIIVKNIIINIIIIMIRYNFIKSLMIWAHNVENSWTMNTQAAALFLLIKKPQQPVFSVSQSFIPILTIGSNACWHYLNW